jgi:hypothetical protein
MSQEYFDNHIILCNTIVHKWAQGISFEIFYKIKIDWAEFRLIDQFIIYIAGNLYPGLAVPRNVLLSKSYIETVIDNRYFSSQIGQITPQAKLKYSTKKDAMNALNNASNVDSFCVGSVSFPQKTFDIYNVGHPYLMASGVLNWSENRCIEGSIDLITGETNVKEGICFIEFCFSGNTQIKQANGPSVPIKKIKSGDRILTMDLKSMKVEEDIVQKVDSVLHNDVVLIEFNDKTINESTSDHPYYVPAEGWCSSNPTETIKKYKTKIAQLQPGDSCIKYENNKLKHVFIKSISSKPGAIMTYNISRLKKNNNYFANGILVSNENF